VPELFREQEGRLGLPHRFDGRGRPLRENETPMKIA